MNNFRVTVRIYVQQGNSGNGLNVEQNFEVAVTDFLDLCRVLAQFQELAKKIERERGPR